ncbi:DUF2249 domain-containing protein [Pedobacter aquae]|uniref:DUF2249 domain-containing protein n=1 Tax=Pedobacter aquae TaxID=2605747 RepID=A0A5C0VHM0_9SPHI|nr:DUF2249 domain-containing protein [Pedobacter aquae]QEK51569.1 DUF2249 domain-containing protein [Pedobacter aquae]
MNSGQINLQTKISVLIKHNSAVIEALADLNPHFNKLRNPLLRKLFAGRVSIADACKIAGTKPEDFMQKMSEIGFEIDDAKRLEDNTVLSLKDFSFQDLEPVTLDVRAFINRQEDPLKQILHAIENLQQQQCLKLINTFEPIPLIHLLAKKGFKHHVERQNPNLVITWFAKQEQDQLKEKIKTNDVFESAHDEFNQQLQVFGDDIITQDVRHLEMPLPMVSILQSLEKLPQAKALYVKHKKVPLILLEQLKERGFTCLMQRVDDKNINLLIFHHD